MIHNSIAQLNRVFTPGKIEFILVSFYRALRVVVPIATVVANAAVPLTAQAQPVPAPPAPNQPAPAQPSCEWHIWPAATPHTTYYGWFHGGEVDGNRRGIKGYPNMYAEALGTPQQASLLSQVDWQKQSSDPNLRVVVHLSTTGTDDDRTRTTRLVAGGGACYRELIITSLVVESAAMSSQSVRVMAIRKRFDGADAVSVNFSSMAMANVPIPEKTGPDFDDRMRAAVQGAFQAAIVKFMKIQNNH